MSRDESTTQQIVSTLATFDGRLTELIAQLRGAVVNNVLFSGTVQLDDQGQWTGSWTVPIGSVALDNADVDAVTTLAAAEPAGFAPVTGIGVHRVPARGARTVNLTGRTLTVYGTPGALISLQVLTKASPVTFG